MHQSTRAALLALITSMALAACGGGNDSAVPAAESALGAGDSTQQTPATAPEAGAPQATGNTATDGVAWFNFRRQQSGLRTLERSPAADAAAQGHSDYERLNDVITHEQTPGAPGFTGETVGDRLRAAGFQFRGAYAYGEVLSQTSSASGISAAEDLIAAVYHRFVILEPVFLQIGGGSAVRNGSTYFTANLVTERLDTGLGAGKAVVYPFAGQQRVPRNFFSDHEIPDPVPSRNEVGYPVSVHADITSVIEVQSFTIRPRGGDALPVQLLQSQSSATAAADPQTPPSAAAIVPLSPLAPATVYDVRFDGKVDGTAFTRDWSFTTQ